MGPSATERSLMMLEEDIERGETAIRNLDDQREHAEDLDELQTIEEMIEAEMQRIHRLERRREELVEDILEKREYPYD